ncbi:hypothetical protein PC9H_007355 [Pleurotus ostreatus]|uniref:Inhibitor I9 domain-containing protein n=1 Tax=Pleurotus ostreatus TaxID=5322 RepID=A0A8H6ZTF6_PLEOS|nr:uncharacterized protein PC9H_007355 [Pleurotus ostreatus]KAF7428136.1 hypothetical protein PC9H_007355 [Pleurotus ostreatus]KAJ8696201.1 hypothetical protein PTI98_006087 [Pleurotus ostreatus]
MSAGKFIVIFKNDISDDKIRETKDEVIAEGGTITNEYNMPGMKGFAGELTPQSLTKFQGLQGELIDSIEADAIVTTQ